MMNSHDAKASPRWPLATTTSTIRSVGCSSPKRWITVQSITFQRHKYDDAFTIEISWSCTNDSPFEATLRDPSAPFELSGVRFRLGRFWEPQKDVWWYVAEPNFGRSLLSVFRPASDPKAAIDAAVTDAIQRIQEHALPYFDRVAEAMT